MGIFSSEYTQELQEVIREIEVDVTEFLGAKYLPAKEVPTAQIYVDVLEARGGMTKEHVKGTDPQATARRQFRTQSFASGAYKEFVRFGEKDILMLRELGQNDQSKRGIRTHLNETALILNNRIETRMEYLRWQAILTGSFMYEGKTVDFGKIGNHDVAPTQAWGANDGAGNFTTANVNANPIADFRFWMLGGYGAFRKYKITKAIMNPNTARMFLDSAKVQSQIQNRFAAGVGYDNYSINSVLQFLIPGAPPVEIYSGWWNDETVDPVSGLITQGDAKYFIPDGRIFFESKLPGGDTLGDFAMTLNLSNGNIDAPAAGKFLIVDEHVASNPGNPYIDVFGGVYGGPRLKRGADLLTATVI